MRLPLRPLTLATLVAATIAVLAAPSVAGPDKVKFPADWKSHVLYTVVDRHDTKQYRELYANTQAVVDALKADKPLPDGTVLTLVQYKAQVDAAGMPVKDARGRFTKGELIALTVMEKRAGWGAEYPAEWRNGEWEYAAFSAIGVLNEKANYKGCFQCHKPHEKADYVISRAALRGAAPSTAAARPDVKIAGFAFGPQTYTGTVAQPVTWVNEDDSPHQITIVGTKERSPVLLKGQSHAMGFDMVGTYEYICGLHPSMKGTIEVK